MHPAIVSVEEFTRAQLVRRSRAAGGMQGIAKLERSGSSEPKRTYLLRGLVRCACCMRKMQGGMIRNTPYYRCIARTLAPGSSVLADHPKTVNLREDALTASINAWIGRVFDRENRDATVRMLMESQGAATASAGADAVRRRLADAERALRSFQAAIGAGVEPAALVEGINQAQAAREAARTQLAHAPQENRLDVAEVHAMIDALGDVAAVIGRAHPERLPMLYRDLRLEVGYTPADQGSTATATVRVASECVRGGT